MHFSLRYAVLKRAVINRISGDYTLMSWASEVAFWTFIVAGGWAFGPITVQAMDNLGRFQGRYPENIVLISQLEECQEEGVKKGGTWRTLRVPDQRHGGHGQS